MGKKERRKNEWDTFSTSAAQSREQASGRDALQTIYGFGQVISPPLELQFPLLKNKRVNSSSFMIPFNGVTLKCIWLLIFVFFL